MIFKIIVVVLMLVVIASLGSALAFLLRDSGTDSKRTVKALTFRIGLSLAVFILLIVGYFAGLIQPHGVG